MPLGFTRHGHGPVPVIMAHSWMTTHTSWAAVRPYLDGQRYSFLLADHRGYGLSREQPGPYNAEGAARDLVELADAEGIDRFHVVGHSMACTDDAAFDGIVGMMTGGRLDDGLSRAHRDDFRAHVDPEAMSGFMQMWAAPDFADAMPGRRTPTLVLAGLHDLEPLRPVALQAVLAPWFDDMSVEPLDSGHFPMWEVPPRFAALLQAFLRRSEP